MSALPPNPPTPPTPPASSVPPSLASLASSPTPGAPGAGSDPRRPLTAAAQAAANARRFDRVPPRPTLHPRRVVGGMRLSHRPPALSAGQSAPTETDEGTGWTWAAARWMRPCEERAPGEQLSEGLEYARAGQTRQLEIKPGMVTAKVQGRMPQAYRTTIRLPTFTPEQWDKATQAMVAQAKYAAALLAGELPSNIEDMFAPAGLSLFPTGAADLSVSCECDVFTGKPRDFAPVSPVIGPDGQPVPPAPRPPVKPGPGVPYCKHVCCLMYLIADRMSTHPLTIFSLRGLAEGDLLERLRQARALQGLQRTGVTATPVYTPHVPGVNPQSVPLEQSIASFWTAPDPEALAGLDMPIALPEVSHPLLRRVGPSPFLGAKFPLVGLLATCYDVISQSVIDSAAGEPARTPDDRAPTDP